MKPRKLFSGLGLLCSLCLSITAHANISPYLPLHTNPALENNIERLAAISPLNNLKKPYRIDEIKRHLAAVKDTHPILYRRINNYLKRYDADMDVTHIKALVGSGSDDTLANSSNKAHAIVNGRGETTDSNYRISARGHYRINDHIAVYAGTEAYEDETLATGSMLAVGWDWAQLDLGYREHWYSPFQQQSRLIGTQAKTMLSATLSNSQAFTDYWNLQYEVFIGQMDKQPVLFNGSYSQDKAPFLIGTYLSVQPVDFWTLSIARTFQMGGGERDVSFSDIAKAFINPSNSDNTGEDLSTDEEAGNQLAAFASQFKFDGQIPYVVSFEIAFEDTSKGKNYLPGNTAFSSGIYFPYITDTIALNYEFSDWQNTWYSHHLYADGYRNDGNVLGHWALNDININERLSNGQSHNLSMYWQQGDNSLITHIKYASYGAAQYDDSAQISIEYRFNTTFDDTVVIDTTYGQDPFGDNFWKLNLGFIW